MLSGIGPAEHLREHGIGLIQHLPGVGRNLQDHVNVNIQYGCTQPITHTPLLKPYRKALVGLQWLLANNGPGATNHFEIAGYIKSRAGIDRPDLQLLFIPLLVDESGQASQQSHGFQVTASLLRSNSRGKIELKSSRPSDPFSKALVGTIFEATTSHLLTSAVGTTISCAPLRAAFLDDSGNSIS